MNQKNPLPKQKKNDSFVFYWWIRITYICLFLGCWKIADFNISLGGFNYVNSRLVMANKPVYNLTYDKFRGVYFNRNLLVDWRDEQILERDSESENQVRKITKPNFEDQNEFRDYIELQRDYIFRSKMDMILAARTNVHSRLKPIFYKNPQLQKIEWHQFSNNSRFIYPRRFFDIQTIGIDDIEVQREVLHILADLKDVDYKDYFGDDVKVVVTPKEIVLEITLGL